MRDARHAHAAQHRIMRRLLRLAARNARTYDEVPITAAVVERDTGRVVSVGRNRREELQSPLAHAEVMAILRAARVKRWNLHDCDLYVTLEPCMMCAGLILEAQIRRVYFAAYDTKPKPHTRVVRQLRQVDGVTWVGGIERAYASRLLKRYFKQKRKRT